MEPASHVLVDDLQHEAAKDIHAERCQREAALCREGQFEQVAQRSADESHEQHQWGKGVRPS